MLHCVSCQLIRMSPHRRQYQRTQHPAALIPAARRPQPWRLEGACRVAPTAPTAPCRSSGTEWPHGPDEARPQRRRPQSMALRCSGWPRSRGCGESQPSIDATSGSSDSLVERASKTCWMHEHPGAVVSKHRTSIDRTGLDPNTKEGELVLAWTVSGPPSSEAKVPSVDVSCCPGMTWCGDRFPCCPGSGRS